VGIMWKDLTLITVVLKATTRP